MDHLQRRGYQILERNWQPGRWGEIDIVAIDKDTLVFVEVKTRGPGSLETPQESVTSRQLHTLRKMALLYSQTHPDLPKALRIDFLGISFPEGKNKLKVELSKNITGR